MSFNDDINAMHEAARASQSVGPKEVEPPPATSFDPAAHTVGQVLAHVEEHPEEAEVVLAAELAGKHRSTVIDALSG